MRQWKKAVVFSSIALVLTVIAVSLNLRDQSPQNARLFQDQFLSAEVELLDFLTDAEKKCNTGNVWDITHSKFIFHRYTDDTLTYWSSNSMPVGKYAELLFPSNGLIHLQNGWYFTRIKHVGNQTFCASFLVKNEYPYENTDLSNGFSPLFQSYSRNFQISLEEDQGFAVRDNGKRYLFSLIESHVDENVSLGQVMTFLYVLIAVFWAYVFWLIFLRLPSPYKWFIPLALVTLRMIGLNIGPIGFTLGKNATDPSLYASSQWFPNFFEFTINCILLIFLSATLRNSMLKNSNKKWLSLLFLTLSVVFWILPRDLSESLVDNSSIPLSIDKLFSLNGYTLLAVSCIAALMYMQYRLFQTAYKWCVRQNISALLIRIVIIISGTCIMCWIGLMEHETIIPELFFMGYLLLATLNWPKEGSLGINILHFSSGTFILALLFHMFYQEKLQSEQQLYAQKLASEETILTELEFAKIAESIQSDPILTRISHSDAVSFSEFKNGLERRIFNGFWERYDIDFLLCDSTGNRIPSKSKATDVESFNKLTELIEKHGKQSAIDSAIFFISDLTDQVSFVVRLPLRSRENESRIFFATLRSKKIPEEIGFPRLLISDKANALQKLEKYSIAKYHKNKLVANYGAFTYPYRSEILKTWQKDEKRFRHRGGYRHCIVSSQGNDLLVLSMPSPGWISLVNGFTYLFLFYGLVLLIGTLRWDAFMNRTLTLAARIQIILLLIVFASLVAFGWGSSTFIRSQYELFSNNMIADKLSSMQLEVDEKINSLGELTIDNSSTALEASLIKLGRIYHADLNLYDQYGFMIASSRPMIYNLGLIGEQMNRSALNTLQFQSKSRFIQQEKIGALNFASAYVPCFNKRGRLLGYLNLQYFGKQKELEEQIESFLVAIVNIFMLLLALSLISALFISNWLTSPLRKLKDSLNQLKLGKTNTPIAYDKEDEIGSLVKAYNLKLNELEFTAMELAKSERESAWREMAKQVAHEIKNPLTPMKLSIQHLERSFDPEDPQSADKISKVSKSLIEQIDALTNIANEFSTFANMPLPNEQDINLVELIENVLNVFRGTNECHFTFAHDELNVTIRADKDQMIRVFNNIIQNALQALSPDREGTVDIKLASSTTDVHIEISDNGVGIPKEAQKRMFTPYFTTKSTGSGLGLAMVKQIVQNHRGEITFQSESNQGTTFFIVFRRN
ncbi:MAG: ATP-binding protein [Cryomorphaceae bacterium]|jgi:signal transduction histidine kinase|nr:ATP-binding protein [Cryomorphaceae bacterium]